MNNLTKLFDYQNRQIRIIIIENEPWFVAKDVCEVLDISKHRDAVARLDEDERGSVIVDTLGGQQEMAAINESGLYSLIMVSRKPEAKVFKRWVTHEVLPAIRKHGGYLTPAKIEEVLLNPDTLIQLAQNLKAEQERNKALSSKVEQDKPKVLFADSVAASKTSILIGDLAKLIKQNGYDIGQNRLFDWLRDNEYLIKGGSSRNMPTQKSMDLGLFEVKESTVNNPDGSIRVTKTTKVTGKGQIYFINAFSKMAS